MLFEDNLTFLVLKILIIFAGTIAMIVSTTSFKMMQKKIAWLVFTGATHILVSLYIAATVTLINTALHGNGLSDILLRLLFYLLAVLFDFYFVRHIWLDAVSIIQKGWGVLSLIPCAFIILSVTAALYPEHYTKRPLSVVTLYLLGAVIVAVYFSIGRYLSMQYDKLQSEQNKEILEFQLENLRRENADMEALEKQTKILRHDLRHILSTIAALAESGDTQAILDFVENTAKLSEDIPGPHPGC